MAVVSILQSGFVTFDTPALTKSKDDRGSVITEVLSASNAVRATDNNHFYSQPIHSVFTEFLGDHHLIKSFEWRERFFKAIKDTLGHNSFTNWLDLQANSPHLTALHKRFLKETRDYLQNDVDTRPTAIETWSSLLEARPMSEADRKAVLDVSFGADFEKYDIEYGKLPAVIQRWITCANGLNDLVYFFGIVFSEKPRFNVA